MLDVLVSASPEDNPFFGVYHKPTHIDHHLKFASHQPLEHKHKLGVIHMLRRRTNITVNKDEEKINEDHHLKKINL